jgi:hypothetical protein
VQVKAFLASVLFCLAAAAGAVDLHGASTVEMSDGRIFKVAYSKRLVTSGKTVTNADDHVWFDDGEGNLVGAESNTEPSGLSVTRFTSVRSDDKIEIRIDFGYAKQGLKSPIQVTINGEKYLALLAADDKAGEAEFQRKLAPALARLSPGFVVGLKNLFVLGESGFPAIGAGWGGLAMVYDTAQLSRNLEVVNSVLMPEAEAQAFASRFGAK